MKQNALLLFFFSLMNLCLFTNDSFSQNVGIGTNIPNASAKLEVTSTSSGFLPPRMTYAQRNAIINPAQGLIIYCLDCGSNGGEPQYYNGTAWLNMVGGTAQIAVVSIPSVIIGSQIWSNKNLDATSYRNGDPIPQVTDANQWSSLSTGAWCWYNNDSATYASLYGRLYNWYAVNDSRGLAPSGWHVATNKEWDVMSKYLDPTVDTTIIGWTGTDIAVKLKNTIGWNAGGNGTNSSGFSGLPGGGRFNYGAFSNVGSNGITWTATEYNALNAWERYLNNSLNYILRGNASKQNGFSIRIVKD